MSLQNVDLKKSKETYNMKLINKVKINFTTLKREFLHNNVLKKL